MIEKKQINKYTVLKFLVVAMVATVGIFVSIYRNGVARAQIDFGMDMPILIEFDGDYEAILACLNSKEWDIEDEWVVEDLGKILACVDGMWQVVADGTDDLTDSMIEDRTEPIDEESEKNLNDVQEDKQTDDWDAEKWECLDDFDFDLTIDQSDYFEIILGEWECFDPDEDIFIAPPGHWNEEWGTLEILSMADVDWEVFRSGDVAEIESIHLYNSNFGTGSFWDEPDLMGAILQWIYAHQGELTDEEFANEVGAVFAVSVDLETGMCDFWEHGSDRFCQTIIFYITEALYQELDMFIWDVLE